jgi:nucleotide-binding universal stress UspA family protein
MASSATIPSKPAPASVPLTPVGPPLQEIVFLTDLHARATAALGHAVLLAERFGARLTVVHLVQSGRHASDQQWHPEMEVLRRQVAEARDRLHLEQALDRVRHTIVVEPAADVRSGVLDRLAVWKPHLVIVPTHGREGLATLDRRSVSDAVLQHGGSPVLCVREPEHGFALPYRRLLVPTDMREASRRAFPLAGLLARAFDAEIVGLHVSPLPTVATLSGVTEMVDEVVPTDDTMLAFLRRDLPGARLCARVQSGSTWDVIVETARAEHADLVVASSHGPDSLRDRLVGTHAERLVRTSPCPVLVV